MAGQSVIMAFTDAVRDREHYVTTASCAAREGVACLDNGSTEFVPAANYSCSYDHRRLEEQD